MFTYYKLSDALTSSTNSHDNFIIASEKLKSDGRIGRFFTVFPDFESFITCRDKFPHCHELIVDHINNKPNIAGRLVFDFDIEYKIGMVIPTNLKKQIEDTILETIKRFYFNINIAILKFVWSTGVSQKLNCVAPKKLSKHLTVKNLYFENWVEMSKIFYQYFAQIWDSKYNWIASGELIDAQIIKKNTSLRMVGSSKISGNLLKLDDNNFTLQNSLIRIYSNIERSSEQLVTIDHMIHPPHAPATTPNKTLAHRPLTLSRKKQVELEAPIPYSTKPSLIKSFNKITTNYYQDRGLEKKDTLNIDKILKLYLDCLKPQRCDIWQHWFRIAIIIFNEGGSFELFNDWSKLSKKYNFAACQQLWKWFDINYKNELTIDTLKKYAKEDDPVKYKEIKQIIKNFLDKNINDNLLGNCNLASELEIYHKAFELSNTICQGVFKMGSINGPVVKLLRIKPHKCLMSNKIHDSENAFLVVSKNANVYNIMFGCYRNCSANETIHIANIHTIDNKITNVEILPH